jgi:uncharacterized protein (DUF1697 family)
MTTKTYVALLRGINVGGNRLIKMDDLKRTFEKLGFINIRSVQATGNIIFQTSRTDKEKLIKDIQDMLHKDFNHPISVILVTREYMVRLIEKNPFKEIHVLPETRLYVSFRSDKNGSSALAVPYESPEKDFKILSVTDYEICSVLTLSPERNTTDVMKILEKEYGKQITTRNWNTLIKIGKFL